MLSKIIKYSIAVMFIFMFVICFGSCMGKKINVTVIDGYINTKLETKRGITVKKALQEAEISLNKGDVVTPKPEEILNSDDEIKISRMANVCVTYNGKRKELQILSGTVKDAIDMAGFSLTDKTEVNYDLDRLLSDNLEIKIVNLSTVTLTADGKTKDFKTASGTIEEFLNENKITLSKLDKISEKTDAKIRDGMHITIKRITTEKITVTEIIEYSTVSKNTDTLSKGKTKVEKGGVNGEKEVTYKVTYVDGEEESRETIKEKIIKQPIDEILLVGTKNDNSGNSQSQASSGKRIVSKEYFDDCDGSGHGVCIITYDDNTTKMIEY